MKVSWLNNICVFLRDPSYSQMKSCSIDINSSLPSNLLAGVMRPFGGKSLTKSRKLSERKGCFPSRPKIWYKAFFVEIARKNVLFDFRVVSAEKFPAALTVWPSTSISIHSFRSRGSSNLFSFILRGYCNQNKPLSISIGAFDCSCCSVSFNLITFPS